MGEARRVLSFVSGLCNSLALMCTESSEHHAKYHLIHYIGHLLLVGPDEQEMASMSEVL